ncbi:hypothetical protein ACL03H_12315 [Saccharopolyspora sp. MS10]|uniref:hypothetical protein n=1 Tax=Saccharopolyspora sp. MS10 TaxID=3385973 RepID=UPI0039A3B08C
MPRNDGTDVSFVVDLSTRGLVGEVLPSDVHRGWWRAAVTDPRSGYGLVCRTERGEVLVDRPQAGTEAYPSPQEALRAVERHRTR